MKNWPSEMTVAQVRVARPTADLKAIIRFYGEGLGLRQIGSFSGHAGYDGVMFGLPGREYHLEFTAETARHGGTPTVREGAKAEAAGAGSQGSGVGDEVSTTCGSGWVLPESSYAPPSRDNLLVLYIPERSTIDRIATRLASMGYPDVPPENPYWAERGITIEDPDGWRIVLMNTAGI